MCLPGPSLRIPQYLLLSRDGGAAARPCREGNNRMGWPADSRAWTVSPGPHFAGDGLGYDMKRNMITTNSTWTILRFPWCQIFVGRGSLHHLDRHLIRGQGGGVEPLPYLAGACTCPHRPIRTSRTDSKCSGRPARLLLVLEHSTNDSIPEQQNRARIRAFPGQIVQTLEPRTALWCLSYPPHTCHPPFNNTLPYGYVALPSLRIRSPASGP